MVGLGCGWDAGREKRFLLMFEVSLTVCEEEEEEEELLVEESGTDPCDEDKMFMGVLFLVTVGLEDEEEVFDEIEVGVDVPTVVGDEKGKGEDTP